MKTTPYLFFMCSLILLAFGSGCGDGMDTGTFNHQNQPHSYGQDDPRDNGNSGQKKGEQRSSKELRELWQRPHLVIDKVGDLTGKVLADIGAGPVGYFTLHFAKNTNVKKVLSLDIDPEAIKMIENYKILLDQSAQSRIETRLVTPNDPKLKPGEADVVIIVNTYVYIEDSREYLKNLKKGIAPGGRLVIIDFKKRYTQDLGPPINYRIALGSVEQDLVAAGYKGIDSDDQTLEYQYIVTANVD